MTINFRYLITLAIVLFLFTACSEIDETPAPKSEIYYFIFNNLTDNGTVIEISDPKIVLMGASFRLSLQVQLAYDMTITFQAQNSKEPQIFYHAFSNEEYPRTFDILYKEGKLASMVPSIEKEIDIKSGLYDIVLRLCSYGVNAITDCDVSKTITVEFD